MSVAFQIPTGRSRFYGRPNYYGNQWLLPALGFSSLGAIAGGLFGGPFGALAGALLAGAGSTGYSWYNSYFY